MSKYRLDSVLHKNQYTLQDCIMLFNSVLKISYSVTVICDDIISVMDLNNIYRMDSVLCIEQCTLQYNIVPCFLTSYDIFSEH